MTIKSFSKAAARSQKNGAVNGLFIKIERDFKRNKVGDLASKGAR